MLYHQKLQKQTKKWNINCTSLKKKKKILNIIVFEILPFQRKPTSQKNDENKTFGYVLLKEKVKKIRYTYYLQMFITVKTYKKKQNEVLAAFC